jgi:predicted ester cyclase
MSPEELKSLACRHLEATWMQYSRQPADATFYFSHEEVRSEGDPLSLEQVRRAISAACPDLALTIETVIAEAGQVVARWTVRGTDTQGYQGRLPTGKQVSTTGIQMVWFEDEHLVRVWEIADLMGILSQLGFVCIPEPPRVTVRRSTQTAL